MYVVLSLIIMTTLKSDEYEFVQVLLNFGVRTLKSRLTCFIRWHFDSVIKLKLLEILVQGGSRGGGGRRGGRRPSEYDRIFERLTLGGTVERPVRNVLLAGERAFWLYVFSINVQNPARSHALTQFLDPLVCIFHHRCR